MLLPAHIGEISFAAQEYRGTSGYRSLTSMISVGARGGLILHTFIIHEKSQKTAFSSMFQHTYVK